jgi:hypothetical protein
VDNVAEELPADRPGTRRGSQHREALGLEEGTQGSDDRRVVALVDPGAVGRARRDLELELDRSLLEPPDDVETCVRKDPQHGQVLGQDDGDEPLDAADGREGGQLLEEPRPDPPPLELVCHRERDFGLGGITKPVVRRDRHDALASVRSQRPDQSATVRPVGLEGSVDEARRNFRHPVEAEMDALGREALEERQDLRAVRGHRGTETERAPVSEDHVERLRLYRHGPEMMPRLGGL